MTAKQGDATIEGGGAGLVEAAAHPWLLATLAVLCLIAFAWLSQLQQQLSQAQSAGATAGVLYPGHHPVVGTPVRTTGDWLQQPLGPETWLTADTPGASLGFTFNGTKVTATVRMGPASGTAYVEVDGRPAPQLPTDQSGAYVSLSGARAVAEPVVLVTGLNHGEHVVTIRNGTDGQLAIAAFDVASQTPSPWAFGLAYAFVFLMLFALVRALLSRAAIELGWLSGERALTIGYGRRRTR